jgi:hypothetical protein
MIKKWLPAIFLTFLTIVLVGIKVYPEVKSKIFKDEELVSSNENLDSDSITEESPLDNDEKHRGYKEDTFPFRTEVERKLAEAYPDQFHIVEKMYYSWDYIDNAQGEFEIMQAKINSKTRGNFYVDFENGRNRATSEQIQDGQVVETLHFLLNDGMITRQMSEKSIYVKEPVENNPRANAEYLYNHFIGIINSYVLNSEWYALIYSNYTDWQYEETEFLGMPAYFIEGTISNRISESLEGPFTMIVSKETGALLDLQCYGKSDEPIYSVTVKNLQINQGVPDNVFHLDVTGSREVDNTEFNLSGVGYTGEEKPGGVDTSGD